jgi:uncharacterized protein
MNDRITDEKLEKYFVVTAKALEMCRSALSKENLDKAKDFLDMATRYYQDAIYFMDKKDYVLAFAALNYAHGWLDAGARIRFFEVNDSTLFTVDDK